MRIVLPFVLSALLVACAGQPIKLGIYRPPGVAVRAPEAAPEAQAEQKAATEERPLIKLGIHRPPGYDKPPHEATPEEQAIALEARVYVLVEAERMRIDPTAKPLSLDPELVDAARVRSQDLAKNGFQATHGPDGDSAVASLMAKDPKFRGLLGENIASQYYTEDTRIDLEDFARRFVESWLGSPDHKANLAYAAYDRTGVGVAVNGTLVYVTQLFSTDLGLPEPPDDHPATVAVPANLPPSPPPEPPLNAPPSH